MSLSELIVLQPLLVLAGTILILLVGIAVYPSHGFSVWTSLLGLGASLGALLHAPPGKVTDLILIDHFGTFFSGIALIASAAVALLAYGYFEKKPDRPEEFYVLLLTATLGAMVLAISNHFASFFMGLELLSVSLYGMIAYLRDRRLGIEAALKYLVLAGSSSAFLLLGMAFSYAATGSLDFAHAAITAQSAPTPLLWLGAVLIFAGTAFKLAFVPFHMWTPDVYEGASAPVAAFIATVSKGAVFAVLIRYFGRADLTDYPALYTALAAIAVISMFVGNFLALFQDNIKRLLAYSSITHLGYLLVAFLAGSPGAVSFYFCAYIITTLVAFGVMTLQSNPNAERDIDRIADYRGFFWQRPFQASLLMAALLSYAGIPLTTGFVGKFYVVSAGISSSRWLLILLLILNSAISVFYYLRLVLAMILPARPVAPEAGMQPVAMPLVGGTVMTMLGFLLVWLGVYPNPLLRLAQTAVAGFLR